MVIRKGQGGVQYLFTEDTFGDHADQARVKAEVRQCKSDMISRSQVNYHMD